MLEAVLVRLHQDFLTRLLRQDAAAPDRRSLRPGGGRQVNTVFMAAGGTFVLLDII